MTSSQTRTVTRHQIFQTSLIASLAQGVYEDEMTLAELLGHGSFGIGTFNGLDGEMVILGGTCYRLRGDGSVSVPDLSERTPYAVVTNFVPGIRQEVGGAGGALSRREFSEVIDALVPSSNYMYALRVTGHFAWASARTSASWTGAKSSGGRPPSGMPPSSRWSSSRRRYRGSWTGPTPTWTSRRGLPATVCGICP